MKDIPFGLRQLESKPTGKAPRGGTPGDLGARLWKALRALWSGIERFVLLLWAAYRYLILSVGVALLFALIVPYNTDEFIHYHTLLCHVYPLNALNTFTGACGALDLNFLNTGFILPLRAYLYSGSFPSLYYLPLFWIWPSPVSARLLSVLFLLLQALVLGKLFRFNPWRVFLGLLLFFPYAFQHIVDTGPVSFQILSIYLLALLFEKWMRKPSFLYPLLAGILAFLAFWTKLLYVAELPAIALLFALAVHDSRRSFETPKAVSRLSAQLLLGVLTFLALAAALLLSTSPHDPTVHPLLDELLQKGGRYTPADFLHKLPTLEVTKALLNPLAATHRVYDAWSIPGSGLIRLYDVLLYLGIPLFAVLALCLRELRASAWKPLLIYTLFPLTFLLIAGTKMAWAMHHTVLSFPYLVLAALSLLSVLRIAKTPKGILLRRCAHIWLGLFFVLSLFWFALFPAQGIRSSDDPSKERVNALLHSDTIAEQYFYVITDWGMYFYQGLYGSKNQSVLYISGLYEQEDFEALKKLSAQHHRQLLFIVNERAATTDLGLIRSRFTLTRCEALAKEGAWQVWHEGALDACEIQKP
jgi:hypothetical protein